MRRNTLPRNNRAYQYTPFTNPLHFEDGDGGGAGGSASDGSDTGGTGDGGTGDDGSSGESDSGTGSTAKDAGQGKDKGDDLSVTVKRLEKELAEARRDAGKARTDAKKQAADDAVKALTQSLGKALGFVKDDAPPDPKALADAIAQKDTTISEKDSVIRAKDVELAVWSRADKLSAKAGALLDSRSFLKAIAELDPSAKGFTTALDNEIKTALKENQAFAVTPSAGKSGGDLSGGTGEGAAKQRPTSLSAAVRGTFNT